jgi:hypothetical protein
MIKVRRLSTLGKITVQEVARAFTEGESLLHAARSVLPNIVEESAVQRGGG